MLPPDFFAWIKLACALAIVLALAALYVHFRSLTAEAARVPSLTRRIASDDAQARTISEELSAAEKARRAALMTLSQWQAEKLSALNVIEKEDDNESAAHDPACAPRDSDRRVRNDTLRRLTRFDDVADAARMP